MKKITTNHLFLYLFIIVFASFVSSCKKDKGNSTPTTPTTPKALSDADSLKYLMYRIMEVSFVDNGRDSTYDLPSYYWYNQVPKLDPLSSAYDSADVLLAKMKTYPVNSATGKLFDKYSFLDHGEVADEIQQGVSGDMGIQLSLARNLSGQYFWYVEFTDPNSPAGLAGVNRAWEITAVNGDKNITYDGSNGPNTQKVVNAVLYSQSATF